MKIIIGLGNPEPKYDHTRHNVGFWLLDTYAAANGGTFTTQPKFKADIATVTVGSGKALLVKPHTYYNLVGESARAIIDFYKAVPQDILIIHDDLSLPLGTIRTRIGGSDGGNNGLKSMNAHLGAEHTARIRIGVWTDEHHGADKVGVVLGKFNTAERKAITDLQPTINSLITDFINNRFVQTTHK